MNMGSGRKKNLLLVINSLEFGGAGRQFIELAKRIDREKYNVTVCLTVKKGQFFDEMAHEDIKLFILQRKKRSYLRISHKLAKILKKERIDILHSYLFPSNIVSAIAGKFCRTSVTILSQRGAYDRVLSRRKQLVMRLFLRFADKVICNSQQVAQYKIITEGFDPSTIATVYNGIDLTKFNDEPKGKGNLSSKRSNNHFILTTIGRLVKLKGIDYAIEATALVKRRYPKTTLQIVGTGEYEDELRGLAIRLGVERDVRFLGLRRDIRKILKETDILVHPSLSEGMPNVILEAMAMSLPVVATAVDGNVEAVVNGETGILVPPERSQELAGALLEILDNPSMGKKFGEAGRKRVEELFDIKSTVAETEKIYQELIAAKGLR